VNEIAANDSVNIRYAAYARTHGKTPDEMMTHDRSEFPGGVMAGFSVWIAQQWRAFEESKRQRRYDALWRHVHQAEFDRWLAALVLLLVVLFAGPVSAQDAIDLSQARLSSRDSIDVRNWPVTLDLRLVTFGGAFERGDLYVEFPGKYNLPAVINMENGPITYTIWFGFRMGDGWHIFAAVQCINDYVPTGPTLSPGQMDNLTYYLEGDSAWHYQPKPGEPIAIFATTGVTRRYNTQSPPPFQFGRSNVMVVPFAAGTYRPTSPQPTPTPTPTPTPVNTNEALVQWAIEFQNWARLNANSQSAQFDALRAQAEAILAAQERQFQNLSAQIQQIKVPQQQGVGEGGVNWGAFAKWALKTGIPALIGLITGAMTL